MQLNKLLSNSVIFGLLLVALTPLFISDTLFFPFITGKNFFFRIVVEIVFAGWLILMVRDSQYRPRRSMVMYSYVALAVILFLATVFGKNPSGSFWSNYERMEGLLGHLHLFAYFLVLGSVLRGSGQWRRFYGALIASSVVVASFAIFQIAGLVVIQQGGVRIDGTLGNATYFAGYLLFHIFFLVYYLRRDTVTYIARWIVAGLAFAGLYLSYTFSGAPAYPIGYIFLVFLVACIAGIALYYDRNKVTARSLVALLSIAYIYLVYSSATRGAIIALFTGGIIALFLTGVSNSGAVRRWTFIGSIAALIIASLLFGAAQTEFGRSNSVLNRFSIKALSDTLDTRTTIWAMALEGVKDRPILGWGPENFIIVFNKYYRPELHGQEPWFDRAHNIFLDWLVGTGVLGLLAYLGLYVAAIYHLWRHTDIEPIGKAVFTGLLAGHMVQNFFVFDQITSYILFFSVLAFVHSHASLPRAATDGKSVVPRRLPDWAEQAVAGIVVIAVIFSLYFYNVRQVRASRQLVEAINTTKNGRENIEHFKRAIAYGGIGLTEARERLLEFGANVIARPDRFDPEVRNDFFALSRDEGKKEVERQQENARQIIFLGSFLTQAGQYADALPYIDRAIELSPRKQAMYFERASALIGLKRYDDVFTTLKAAYELAPEFEIAKRLYIVGAIYGGQDDIVAELSAGSAIPFDQRVLNAYVNTGRFDKAVEQLEGLVADEPANAQAHISLAIAYANLDRRSSAIRELRVAGELSPEIAEQVDEAVRALQSGRNPFRQ